MQFSKRLQHSLYSQILSQVKKSFDSKPLYFPNKSVYSWIPPPPLDKTARWVNCRGSSRCEKITPPPPKKISVLGGGWADPMSCLKVTPSQHRMMCDAHTYFPHKIRLLCPHWFPSSLQFFSRRMYTPIPHKKRIFNGVVRPGIISISAPREMGKKWNCKRLFKKQFLIFLPSKQNGDAEEELKNKKSNFGPFSVRLIA